jgi:hypothetical protein
MPFPLLLVLTTVLSLSAAVPDFPQQTYDRLVQQADWEKLYQDPQWLALLHYHKHGNSWSSDIDGGYFFLSPSGKTDSRAEMDATLRAFLSKEDLSPPLDSGMEAARMHPLCKFPARLHFFRDRLGLTDSMLPAVDCSRFQRWRNALKPQSATLVFASSYLNNPASMFGHTFLRLNTYSGSGNRAILNYGIGYAAAVPPTDGGIPFILKGASGAYRGYYSLAPYYISLQKYSNLESRELWEYDLNFTPAQMDYLLEHSWELGAAWMHYYFFTENCSYNILTLLEAANPDLHLSDFSGGVVIPAETVHRVSSVPGLVKGVHWRPSLLSSFRLKYQAMGKPERALLRHVLWASDSDSLGIDAAPFGKDTVAAVLDADLDWVQYKKRRSHGRDSVFWSQKQDRLLEARSQLPAPSGLYPVQRDDRITPPEDGHAPKELSFNSGISDYDAYVEGGYRFAYQDLNARENGFLPGGQIEALKLRVRAYLPEELRHERERFQLEELEFLNLQSLTPMTLIQHPPSWALRIGIDNRPLRAHEGGLSLNTEGGVGAAAWIDGPVVFLPYVLLQIRASAAEKEDGVPNVGPQIRVGGRFSISDDQSLLLEGCEYHPVFGKGNLGSQTENDLSVEYRLSVGRNNDLRLSVVTLDGIGEFSFKWNHFF